jgi:hypothetical protein
MPPPPRPNPSGARPTIDGGAGARHGACAVARPEPSIRPHQSLLGSGGSLGAFRTWPALDLIGFPGKPGRTGKRPRFRLTTKQTERLGFLLEIDRAVQAAGINAGPWLHRSQRAAPMAGRTPLQAMTEDGAAAMTAILRSLTRSAMQRALRGGTGRQK